MFGIDKKQIIATFVITSVFLIFFIQIVSAPTPGDAFFENCDDISEWVITGEWEVTPGECRAKSSAGGMAYENMTSGPIDLSAGDIEYANLSFSYDHNKLDAGEYFTVYVNNTVTGFTQVFQTDSNDAGSEDINISKYITLDSGVHIRASCNNNDRNEECKWDNINITIYSTSPEDSCSCPASGSNWVLNMTDDCNITTTCNIGTGNITFDSAGTTTFNATITAASMGFPPANSILFIGSDAIMNIG